MLLSQISSIFAVFNGKNGIKNNAMIQFLHNLAVVCVIMPFFSSKFFNKNHYLGPRLISSPNRIVPDARKPVSEWISGDLDPGEFAAASKKSLVNRLENISKGRTRIRSKSYDQCDPIWRFKLLFPTDKVKFGKT
jgi:hypothetical protein